MLLKLDLQMLLCVALEKCLIKDTHLHLHASVQSVNFTFYVTSFSQRSCTCSKYYSTLTIDGCKHIPRIISKDAILELSFEMLFIGHKSRS